MPGRRVHIVTYGCQMNEHDSGLIAAELAAAGYELVDAMDRADVVLFNTCSVRDQSERRVLGAVQHLKRRKAAHPDLVIGVGGCMVQRRREALFDELPFIDLAWGTSAVHQVVGLVDQAGGPEPILCVPDADHALERDKQVRRLPTGPLAQVSVMRGCDKACAFCIVPTVRGPQRSKRLGDVLDEVQHLTDSGAREIMLIGQNVNAWGKDLDDALSFADLLRAVDRISGVQRVRFTTSHPRDMSDAIIEAMAAAPSVCEHIHLPVQSGSDRMLKAMRRNYRRASYVALVERLRKAIPGLAITTDIIVGFPGESDADLEATRTLMDNVGFDGAFIFKFSPRPGTTAAESEHQLPEPVIAARHAELLTHQKALSSRIVQRLRGTAQEVLVTQPAKRPAYMMGKTRGMKTALVPGGPALIGHLMPLRVVDTTEFTLIGAPLGAAVAV